MGVGGGQDLPCLDRIVRSVARGVADGAVDQHVAVAVDDLEQADRAVEITRITQHGVPLRSAATASIEPKIVEVVTEVIRDICRRGVAVLLVEQFATRAVLSPTPLNPPRRSGAGVSRCRTTMAGSSQAVGTR